MQFKNVFDLFSSDNLGLIAFGGLIIFFLFVVPNLGFKKDVMRISESKKQAMYRRVRIVWANWKGWVWQIQAQTR